MSATKNPDVDIQTPEPRLTEEELREIRQSRELRAEIDRQSRPVVMHYFLSAMFWLLAGSALAILASIKLHTPEFLDGEAWLNFGVVRPAHLNTMVYGWASMGGLGVAIWMMSRLCRSPLRGHAWLHLSVVLLNIGNAWGTYGVLTGGSTSYEWLEYPRWPALVLALGFVPVIVSFIDMVSRRHKGHVYVSQWYLMAAVFWFPWLFITAQVTLFWMPVAAPAMPPINWWYAHNALGLWFTPIGLAAAYYFIPKVLGKPIHSYYLSMIGFWSLAFFYAWNGMHHLIGGPYPVWLVNASIVASVMMLVPVITVAVNHHLTVKGSFDRVWVSPTLRFIVFSAMCYTLVSVQGSLTAVRMVNRVTHFTHYTVGHAHLGMYAFVTMMLFGSMYYIIPRLTGKEWPSKKLIALHFWLTGGGVLVYWGALTIGGIIQGLEMLDPSLDFTEVVLGTLPYLQIRTYAGIAMTAGHLVFALSLGILLLRRKQLVEAPLFEKQQTGTSGGTGSTRQPETAGTV